VVSFDAEAARARVMLGAVLPLLEPLSRARSDVARRLSRTRGIVQLEAQGSDVAARLCMRSDGLRVEEGRGSAVDVRCVWATNAALAGFFAGKPALPQLTPAYGLRHAVLLFECVRMLAELRVLEPPSARARARMSREEQALRVELVLQLLMRALSRLHKEGWTEMTELADASPERVYQWVVGGSDIAVFLRMQDGRVQSGRGIYPHREPFVRFAFPSVEAAFDVLMATESSMSGFRGGRVETTGSPEYARKMGLLMQKVDAFLQPASGKLRD
jgi:hypothetical protein